MKKITALLNDKQATKTPAFKQIYRIYKACLREHKKADDLKSKAKETLKSFTKKKPKNKEEVKVAKTVYKMAKNYEDMWTELLKSAKSHLIKWDKIYEANKEVKGSSKTKGKKTTKKKKEAKAAVKDKKQPQAAQSNSKSSSANKKLSGAKPTVPKITEPVQDQTTPPSTAKKVAMKAPAQKDNLKRIEGVGPKIESLLNDAGILTFNQVARTSAGKLQGILDKAGSHFKFADPATWPQQAKLANAGKWTELAEMKKELKAGK